MFRLLIAYGGFLLCISSLAALGQGQHANAADQGSSTTTIHANAQEVELDMTFRDRKGKAIRDIRPEEVHVFEDGVEQKMTSFQLMQGGATPNPETAQAVKPLDPLRQVRLVTLVFEGLDPDGKRFFRQALKDILDMAPQQNLYFSVMTIDQKLHCIQPFTADHAALMASVEKSAMWSYVQYQNNSTAIKDELKNTLTQGEPNLFSEQLSSGGTIQSSGGGPPTAGQIQEYVNWKMAKMQYDMLEAAASSDREYDARGTVDALMTLVRSEAELPGRKVVLYFNPYLYIAEMVKEQYKDLISVANRANVTFYTVDPKGLTTWSQAGSGQSQLNGATGEIRSQQMSGGVGEVSMGQAQAMDNAADSLRANPLLWLRDLAQQTGGVTIAETNDLRAPLKAVMDEVETFYEASYAPHIANYDGKFRNITVRVDRPDVVVHARSGYFALPPLKGNQQLSAFELPLLNAISATPTPQEIAFHAAAERFDEHGPKIEYMVTLETPLKEVTFTPQPDHKTASFDAALLAVIKNPSDEIVEKFSKDFAVQVPADKIDAYQQGNLVQTFRTELSPGNYTLESVVMDRNGHKTGVQKTAFMVPEPSNKLSISDVVIVRKTEEVKDNQMSDAFYFPGGKIVPSLSDTLKGGPGNILPFYFSVYTDPKSKDSPLLTMAFYKDGQYLGAAQAPLPQPQPDGRIPYIANLPADKFTPGPYEIRIGVTQGSDKVEGKVDFQVD